jgi:hypothetical protein
MRLYCAVHYMSLLLRMQIAKVAAAVQERNMQREQRELLFQGYPVTFLWQQIMRETFSSDVRRSVSDSVSFAPVLGIEQPTRTAVAEAAI